jgi:hypothetical protein
MIVYRALACRIARPRADWLDNDEPQLHGTTVFEPEQEPQSTGILDANGIAIFRVHQPNPIGFVR